MARRSTALPFAIHFCLRVDAIRDETVEVVQSYFAGLRERVLACAEQWVLEMIANGVSLPDVVRDWCADTEVHAPGAVSFVLRDEPQ
jgi:hypothetical protein